MYSLWRDTMTKAELKKLAEFAAEFLGHRRDYDHWNYKLMGHNWHPHKDFLVEFTFSDPRTAPLISHLGKREMEKRGFEIRVDEINSYELDGVLLPRKTRIYIRRDNHQDSQRLDWELAEFYEDDENNFIALWSAIEATGEK